MFGLHPSLSMALFYNTANATGRPTASAPSPAAPAKKFVTSQPSFRPLAINSPPPLSAPIKKARQLCTLDKLPETILSLICHSLPCADFNSLLQTSRGLQRVCSLPSNLNPKAHSISHHIIVNIMPLFIDVDIESQKRLSAPDFLPTEEYPGPRDKFPLEKIIASRKRQVEEISKLPQPAQAQSLHILVAQYWIENNLRNEFGKNYADVETCRTRLALSTNFNQKCAIIKEYVNKESYGAPGSKHDAGFLWMPGSFNLLLRAIWKSTNSLYINLIKHLLKVGANVNGTPGKGSDSHQGTIAACIRKNKPELLKLFLEKGASPDGQVCDFEFRSPPIFILADRICGIKEKTSAFEVFFQYYPNPFIQAYPGRSLADILQEYKKKPSYTGYEGSTYNIEDVEDRILLLENYTVKFKAKIEQILLKAEVTPNALAQVILDYI